MPTIISGVDIDAAIKYTKNDIKEAIINNDPIEDKLHVIIVVSNPCLYAIRYILAKEFIQRTILEEPNVELYVVELVYPGQEYIVTQKNNKNHLQLKADIPLWHKENMINIGVERLLPPNWKAFAWIDADIEFDNPNWALDTLKVLNGSKDIVQMFSHCLDMDQDKSTMATWSSAGYQHVKTGKYTPKGPDYWHPGYAWAITRNAYNKIGSLYQDAILGSGDQIMCLSLANRGTSAINKDSTQSYKDSVSFFQSQTKNLRFGYVPGIIRHYFHGTKQNRFYNERWKILVKHNFDPKIHIKKDPISGVLVPTDVCPKEMLTEIMDYFHSRKEDPPLGTTVTESTSK